MSSSVSKMAVQAFALSVGLSGCTSLQDVAETPTATPAATALADTSRSLPPASPPLRPYVPAPRAEAPKVSSLGPLDFEPIAHLDILQGRVQTLDLPLADIVETAQFNNCALYPRSDESSANHRWVLDCGHDFSKAGTYLAAYILNKRAEEKSAPAPAVKPVADPLHNRFQG